MDRTLEQEAGVPTEFQQTLGKVQGHAPKG